MKKFIALLLAAVLIVSMIGVVTAFAGCSISGDGSVYPGQKVTYTGKASYSAYSLVAKIEGFGKYDVINEENNTMSLATLSGRAKISVTIPSDAPIGTTYTISFSGQYDNGSSVDFGTSKTITVVQKPKPTPKPDPTGWELAENAMIDMAAGGSYDLEITDTKVPDGVLKSLKEKQAMLNVNFGSYSCSINGAELGTIPDDLKSIDLGLTMEKDEAFSAAVGGADAYQLHFAHQGALPGRITYKFKADLSSPGDIVYLYYYYGESGVTEAVQECVVDAEGFITVSIYHCSSYFISKTLIEGAAGIIVQPTPEATPTPELTPTPEATPTATPEGVVKPADQANGLTVSASGPVGSWFGIPYAPLIAAMAAAALVAMLLTMMATRSGLFRKRVRVREASAGYISTDDTGAEPEPYAAEPQDDEDDIDDGLE